MNRLRNKKSPLSKMRSDDTAFMYDEDDWADEKYEELLDDAI